MEKNKEEIKKILPDPNSNEFERIKDTSPFYILQNFAEAIGEKYNKKIAAKIISSYRLIQSKDNEYETPVFSFFLTAPIGNGYMYKLIEVQQLTGGPYPVKIRILEDLRGYAGKSDNNEDFYNKLFNIFKMPLVSTIILNLVNQVDLYNEYRSKK